MHNIPNYDCLKLKLSLFLSFVCHCCTPYLLGSSSFKSIHDLIVSVTFSIPMVSLSSECSCCSDFRLICNSTSDTFKSTSVESSPPNCCYKLYKSQVYFCISKVVVPRNEVSISRNWNGAGFTYSSSLWALLMMTVLCHQALPEHYFPP